MQAIAIDPKWWPYCINLMDKAIINSNAKIKSMKKMKKRSLKQVAYWQVKEQKR
jgi:hypothetical protein